MVDSTSQIKDFSLSLPITQAAHSIAQQFAQQQPTPQKAEQVHLNTLAVCVVNDYLQMMGIPTDLRASDSWNPVVRLCANVADLKVIGVGLLECRPIRAGEQTCCIPPEVWQDRIGYVVVQLAEPLQEATVLGFAQTLASEQLLVSQLQPLEDLLNLLKLMQPGAATTVNLTSLKAGAGATSSVKLSRWLQDIFETGWQTVESLLASPEAMPAFSFRKANNLGETISNNSESKVRRAKLIDLGMQLADYPVALVLELKLELNQKTGIRLQVHPIKSQTYLPPLLQLVVLDETGVIFLEAKSRHADNYIQLQFSGKAGECFSVQVALGDISITEYFVI